MKTTERKSRRPRAARTWAGVALAVLALLGPVSCGKSGSGDPSAAGGEEIDAAALKAEADAEAAEEITDENAEKALEDLEKELEADESAEN